MEFQAGEFQRKTPRDFECDGECEVKREVFKKVNKNVSSKL